MTLLVALAVLLAIVAGYAVIVAFPVMLVLGALHSSDGLSAVPALGFFQTLGVTFVAHALFGASATSKSS
jgi:hypothetical protein